jgi:Flp pilus assembly protein TadD
LLREADPAAYASYRAELDRMFGARAGELESYFEGAIASPCRTAYLLACLRESPSRQGVSDCRVGGTDFEQACAEARAAHPAAAASLLDEAARHGPVPSASYGELAALEWRQGESVGAGRAARQAEGSVLEHAWLNETCACSAAVPVELLGDLREAGRLAVVAKDHFARGDAEGSIAALKDSLKLDPSAARAHFMLGVVQEYMGLRAEAAGAYRRASELDLAERKTPSLSEASAKGLLSARELGWIEAERRAVAGGSRRDVLAASRERDEGVRLFLAGERSRAEKRLARSVRLDPDDPQAWLSLGVSRAAAGDRAGAAACYEKALSARERWRSFVAAIGARPPASDPIMDAIVSSRRSVGSVPP